MIVMALKRITLLIHIINFKNEKAKERGVKNP